MWVMLVMAVMLYPLVVWDRKLVRRDGAVLLGAYLLYMVTLVFVR
jgi:Ca2+/H+ antiporter